MGRKEKKIKAGCVKILWTVMVVFLCAVSSVQADVTVEEGEELDIATDVGGILNVKANGTANLYTGFYAANGIYAFAGSTVNIHGGTIGYWITVFSVGGGTAATVTVYGTDFTVSNGTIYSDPSGTWFTVNDPSKFVVLTGTYGEYQGAPGGTINLSFSVASNIPIFLAAPDSGEPEVLSVDIDIKPGSDPNPINPGSNGVIPVAILTTDSFDASTVDPGTVTLAGAEVAVRGKSEKTMARLEDVDGDGDNDLLLQVETQSDGTVWEAGPVTLTGETYDGQAIQGTDVVVIVPPE